MQSITKAVYADRLNPCDRKLLVRLSGHLKKDSTERTLRRRNKETRFAARASSAQPRRPPSDLKKKLPGRKKPIKRAGEEE
jgi:hypothetical protein